MSSDMKTALKRLMDCGVSIAGIPALGAKLPKAKMGALVDKYHDIRELRLALGKVAEQVEAEEKRITEHIINNVDADAEGGAVGKRYKGIIKREQVPVPEDWDAIYAHIKKTGNFDLLNKALNRAAVKERWEDGKTIPGVASTQVKKLSVTKV